MDRADTHQLRAVLPRGRVILLDGASRDGAAGAARTGDLDPAGLAPRRRGEGHVQDTVGVGGGEVLRVHTLTEGQLPGERPLGSLGDNNLLALAVGRGALGLDRQGAGVDEHLDAVRVDAIIRSGGSVLVQDIPDPCLKRPRSRVAPDRPTFGSPRNSPTRPGRPTSPTTGSPAPTADPGPTPRSCPGSTITPGSRSR